MERARSRSASPDSDADPRRGQKRPRSRSPGGTGDRRVRARSGKTWGRSEVLKTYKEFLLDLPDDISPEDAAKEYEKYKLAFQQQGYENFFQQHWQEDWFQERYLPSRVLHRRAAAVRGIPAAVIDFEEQLAAGQLEWALALDEPEAIAAATAKPKEETPAPAAAAPAPAATTEGEAKKEAEGEEKKAADGDVEMKEAGSSGGGGSTAAAAAENKEPAAAAARLRDDTPGSAGGARSSGGFHNNCLIATLLPPSVKRADLVALFKDVPGFRHLFLTEADVTTQFYRHAYIYYSSYEACSQALRRFAGHKALGFALRLQAKEQLVSRVSAPSATLTKERLAKDLATATQLAAHMDRERGLNHLLLPTLLDTRSAAPASQQQQPEHAELLSTLRRLNLVLQYLRQVHCYEYYTGVEAADPEAFFNKIGEAPRRNAAPESVEGGSVETWLSVLDSRLAQRLAERQRVDPSVAALIQEIEVAEQAIAAFEVEKAAKAAAAPQQQQQQPAAPEPAPPRLPQPDVSNDFLQKHLPQFCADNTEKKGEGKYQCKLCLKLFKGPEFVAKHIQNKHPDQIESVVKKQALEDELHTAFFNDPSRPGDVLAAGAAAGQQAGGEMRSLPPIALGAGSRYGSRGYDRRDDRRRDSRRRRDGYRSRERSRERDRQPPVPVKRGPPPPPPPGAPPPVDPRTLAQKTYKDLDAAAPASFETHPLDRIDYGLSAALGLLPSPAALVKPAATPAPALPTAPAPQQQQQYGHAVQPMYGGLPAALAPAGHMMGHHAQPHGHGHPPPPPPPPPAGYYGAPLPKLG